MEVWNGWVTDTEYFDKDSGISLGAVGKTVSNEEILWDNVWLVDTNIDLSSVKSSIIDAAAGSVYFIYPDYDPSHLKGNGAIAASLSDFTALGFIYGMTANTQLECLDTPSSYVVQSSGKPSLTGKGIVLVGRTGCACMRSIL